MTHPDAAIAIGPPRTFTGDPAHDREAILRKIEGLLVEVHDTANDRIRQTSLQAAAVWTEALKALSA